MTRILIRCGSSLDGAVLCDLLSHLVSELQRYGAAVLGLPDNRLHSLVD